MAYALAILGDVANAKGVADRILTVFPTTEERAKGPTYHGIAYVRIVYAQAQRGDIAGARDTARAISVGDSKQQAFCFIIEAMSRARVFKDAENLAEALTDPARRAQAGEAILTAKIEARLEANDFVAALQTAGQVESTAKRESLYGLIASGLAHGGDCDAATSTANLIVKDPFTKARSMAEIAAARAKAGDLGGARAILATLDDPAIATKAYRSVAAATTARGDLDGFDAWVATLRTAWARAYSLLGAAEGVLG